MDPLPRSCTVTANAVITVSFVSVAGKIENRKCEFPFFEAERPFMRC